MDSPLKLTGASRLQVITTGDGISTIYSEAFDASYHSTHGALEESESIYINLGFNLLKDTKLPEIRILEMGFGTGLNAILTLREAEKFKIAVSYTGIEAFPVPIEILMSLRYDQFLSGSLYEAWKEMHLLSPEKLKNLSPLFDFRKIIGRIEEVSAFENAELIYYDAFAPQIQPKLWEKEIMQKMYDVLVPGGILVTYCAQGAFKRTLKEIGFHVESHPGPGRKREVTRAQKPLS